MCICQTTIAIPRKGNVERHLRTVKKHDTDPPVISCQPRQSAVSLAAPHFKWTCSIFCAGCPSLVLPPPQPIHRLCRSPLLHWSPPACGDVGWSLRRRCWQCLQLFSAGAPGPLLSLPPRPHRWDWISWSAVQHPLCAWSLQTLLLFFVLIVSL